MVVGDFPIDVDTLVVGAGPGGYVAAIRAAQLGQDVTIVDKDSLGGTCLNIGCIPSKALIEAGHMAANAQGNEELGITTEKVNVDFSKVQKWKGEVVNKLTSGVSSLMKGNKVDVINGEVYFVDDKSVRIMDEKNSQTSNYKYYIIPTCSSQMEIPGFEYSDRILDSEATLALEELSEILVVILACYICIELGSTYTSFATDITLSDG